MKLWITQLLKNPTISNSITQHPIHKAQDTLMVGHSKFKTFTLPSNPPQSIILRGAEGEVAESILYQRTLDDPIQSYYRQHQLLIITMSTDYKHKAQHHSKKHYTHQSITNRISTIPKPILRASSLLNTNSLNPYIQ